MSSVDPSAPIGRRALALVALPAVIVAMLSVVLLAVAMVRTPDELNLSEVAALADSAEVARLTEEGHDVNARRSVRPGLMDDSSHELTPLEAVVSIRRPELVAYLVARGARPAPERWPDVWCGAVRGGDPDVIANLEPARPEGVVTECERRP